MPATLEIETLTIDARVAAPVARDERRSRPVIDRLTASVRTALPHVLDRVLAGERDDDGIVFIETLRFEATINAGWPAERIAHALAAPLALSLWRAIERPEAVRFADRAEMLACFLSDVAHGAGFARDWHRAFDGLRALPASGVLRTLVEAEPRVARTALARLRPIDLDRVLATLEPTDAARALAAVAALAGDDAAAEPGAIVAAMLEQGCHCLADARERLALLIALARRGGPDPGDRALAIARLIVLVTDDAGSGVPVAARIERASRRLVAEGDGYAASAMSLVLPDPEPDAVAEAAETLRAARPGGARELPGGCGGGWVLLPAALARAEGAAALAALAISAGPRAGEIWGCAALREALGVTPDALVVAPAAAGPVRLSREDRAHLRRGAAALPLGPAARRRLAGVAAAMMAEYARRLPGFATASLSHLWDNLLGSPARVRIDGDTVEVDIAPPPLSVIWSISGADRVRCTLPDGRRLVVGMRR